MIWAVGRSSIQGHGIICTQAVPAGTSLGISHWWSSVVGGQHEFLTKGTFQRLEHGRWNTTSPLGQYHNHSNDPTCRNVTVGPYRYLVTLRDLRPGDEATTDYRLQPDLEQPRPGWK